MDWSFIGANSLGPSAADLVEGNGGMPYITDGPKEVKGHLDISISGLDNLVASNMSIASSITYAAKVIATELQKIASELERNNRLSELRDLKGEMRDCEQWLYENNLLDRFYKEVDMSKKYINAIEPSANDISFLAGICHSKYSHLYEYFFNNAGDAERVLQNGILLTKSEPISYVQELIYKNGIGCFYGTHCFGYQDTFNYDNHNYGVIRGTRCLMKLGDSKCSSSEFICTIETGSRPMYRKKTAYVYTFTEQQVKELVESSMSLYKNACISEKDRLSWIAFYKRMNSEIALENLRMLATELDSFTRKMKIQQSL